MSAPDLKIVTLRESSLRDVPAQLRNLAKCIEAGDYGPVGCCGVVIMGSTFEVFGYGDVQEDGVGPSVCTLLQAGVHRIVSKIERHGQE